MSARHSSRPDPFALPEAVEKLLLDLLEATPSQPDAYLARSAVDPDIRRQALDLYERSRRADALLERVGERAARLLADDERSLAAAGMLVGSWRLLELIGQGGMSAVYRAERADGHFQQTVAVKLLPSGPAIRALMQRFDAERRILARLEHPNLARLIDGGVTDAGLAYLVMEYVEGVPIDRYCDEHRLSVDQRLALFDQVLDVVQYAHRNLVVHRDLKPSNILVSGSGQVKLLDFGIAKVLDANPLSGEATDLTRWGGRPLTPAWASPEQLRGDPVTTASDVYSLGLLLYQLLTGLDPFRLPRGGKLAVEQGPQDRRPITPSVRALQPDRRGEDPSVRAMHRGTGPRRLARRLRGDLDVILQTALREEVERRYASVEQFSADLKRHREGLPVLARPDRWSYRAGKFLGRHWVGATLGMSMLVVILAGAGGILWQSRLVEAEARETRNAYEFVRTLLSVADPYRGVGFHLSPRELMEHASQSALMGELAAGSQVQVLLLMGQIYSRLSQFDSAAELLRLADSIAAADPGIDPLLRAELLLELAIVEYGGGSLGEAADYVRHSLDLLTRALGDEHGELIPALIQKAIILQEQGEYKAALVQLDRALAIQNARTDEEPVRRANTIRTRGYVYEKMTRFEEAQRHYREAAQLAASHLPVGHLHLAELYNDIGRIGFWLGHYEEAVESLQLALDMRAAKLPPEDRSIGASNHNLGISLYAMGDADRGAAHLEEAVRIYSLSAGADNWLTARGQWSLALVLSELGQHQRADQLFATSLATTERVYGTHHRDPIRLLMAQAYVLNQRGDYVAAARIAEDALQRIDSLDAQREEFRRITLSRLAVSLAGMGRWDDSERLESELCSDRAWQAVERVTAYTEPCAYAGQRNAELRLAALR